MPRAWRFHYDNTTSEGKNQTCFSFYAMLVATDVFTVIDGESSEVGHTHNYNDQRFAVASALVVKRGGVLEDSESFANHIMNIMPAIDAHTPVHVEIIHRTYDWDTWLRQLGCSWSGHTNTKWTKALDY